MRKRVYFLVIMSVLALGWMCTSYAASNDVSVVVNGNYVDFSGGYGQPFISDENRTFVPLRGTAEAYGCDVYWDQSKQEVKILYQGLTASIIIGQPYVYTVSGAKVMDTCARIIDGRTYLPIRFVMEAMGAKVDWDSDNHVVIIESPTYVSPLTKLKNNMKSNAEFDSKLGYKYGDIVDDLPLTIGILYYDPVTDDVTLYVEQRFDNESSNFIFIPIDEPYYKQVNFDSGIRFPDNDVWQWSGQIDKSRYSELDAYEMIDTNIPVLTYKSGDRSNYLDFTITQTEAAMKALDKLSLQYSIGVSSSDFGFHK
ncbi:MAG: copper amine oxidase N-terminal domain-containing protein [Clostridia bacterium]|nr:copper amine oxidase N-terminal domain-containing protein [Clostridia bacterium]